MPRTSRSAKTAFDRIDAWLSQNAPKIHSRLAPPVKDAALGQAEQKLGQELPAAVRAFFAWHDGREAARFIPRRTDVGASFFGPLPLKTAVTATLSARRGGDGFGGHWFVIGSDGSGDYLIVELPQAKRSGGTTAGGRVIEWQHEERLPTVVARSLDQRFREIADGMERGLYQFDPASGQLEGPRKPSKKRPATVSSRKFGGAAFGPLRKALALVNGEHRLDQSRQPQWTYEHRPFWLNFRKKFDPKGKLFGPPVNSRVRAVFGLHNEHGHPALFLLYKTAEPLAGCVIGGIRIFSVPEMIHASKDHWEPRRAALIFAESAAGERFGSLPGKKDENGPIVRYPAGVILAGLMQGQLARLGKVVAPDLQTFLSRWRTGRALGR